VFNSKKVSASERARVFDYLIFKVKHGGNIVTALKTYMEGNKAKASRPVQTILDRIAINGEAFVDVALEVGLIDKRGFLILTSNVEASKALPVIRSNVENSSFGVTGIILKDIAKKWLSALAFGAALALDVVRDPMVSVFTKMNQAAVAAGSTPAEVPIYLSNQWFVLNIVLGIGLVIAALLGGLFWLNSNRTDLIYRFLRFRFYEDWVSLLDLYLAFKASGQSDLRAAQSLAASQPEGSFVSNLFLDVADSMRKSGRSFYDSLAEYEDSFPPEVLAFFLDASKTGRIDAYMLQAKLYCVHRLEKLISAAKVWVPAITGVFMLMTFGLMVADLFVQITMVSMKPITG
jgi:hypothetical protein